MDDTQASTTEAATRKRRSSILKSQRPPRTPLSELEFHVATPPDTTKSRRVSFSKRTGVAEFATNEATTTWKNFYEEHNRTLESSGNETAANAPRPSAIGHIGKGIFDQQFEEIELVDIGGALQSNQPIYEFQSSLNNINFTQQLSAFELECLRDGKVSAPIQNFELSSLPDQNTKVFGDERSLQITEMSNPISINFSNIKPIGDKVDDLDEILRDLERSRLSAVCPAPFRANVSEYIEIDLNMTNACMRNDDCDMSITDTILSPKVQAVSKNIPTKDNKLNDEWVIDKENIAINPYATPKESLNFAINEVDDKVLVFDGKKLRVQSERQPIPDVGTDNFSANKGAIPKRKSTLQYVNDLPNFTTENVKKSIVYDDCDLSITQTVDNKENYPKRKTIVLADDMGNISVTQVVPAKVIINEKEKRKTVIYESDTSNISNNQPVFTDIKNKDNEKSKTVIYENDISFTQALPANVIFNKTNQNKTVCYQDGLDMSVTQMIPGIVPNETKSLLVDEDLANISMTQVIPSSIIITNKHEFDETNKNMIENIYCSQGVTENLTNNNEKRKTIIFDANESGSISITEAIPNILIERVNKSIKTNGSLNEKRKTIVFDGDESGSISITEAIPNILLDRINKANKTCGNQSEKRKTIVFDGNESGSISITEAIPDTLLDRINNANRTSDYQNENIEGTSNRRKTIIYNDDECDISITQAIPSNIVPMNCQKTEIIDSNIENNELRSDTQKTVIYNQEEGNVSMTRVIPTNIQTHEENKDKTTLNDNNMDISVTRSLPTNILSTDNKTSFEEPDTFNKENITTDFTNLNQQNNTLPRKSVHELIIEEHESFNISKMPQIETMEIQNDFFINNEKNVNKNLPIANFPCDVSFHRSILVYHNLENKLSGTNTNSTVSNDLNKYDYILSEETEQCNKAIKFNHSTTTLTKSVESKSIESNKVEMSNKLIETVSDKTIENIEEEIKNSTKENNVKISHGLKEVQNGSISQKQMNVEHVVSKQNKKKSILCELLDMSYASLEDVASDVNIKNEIGDKYDQKNFEKNVGAAEAKSSDSMFIITSDSDNEIKANIVKNSVDLQNYTTDQKIKSFTIRKSLENIEDVEMDDLQNKISELKTIDEENHKFSNRHYEKVVSSDLRTTIQDFDKSLNKVHSTFKGNKSIADANDTKDLLKMLSQLTDDDNSCDGKLDMEKSHDIEKSEYNRVSILAKRQSLPLNREEILNNLSRAHAILQKSQYDYSIDECSDINNESSLQETKNVSKKTVRISTDVVKTLKFDDESYDNISKVDEIKTSPLKKTAYGEITYVKDDKTKVIPSYLEDVSDGIKSLMHDLVKPTDDMPFDVDRPTKQSPSTCSTQIQANLITSSQIDIDYELSSNVQSTVSIVPTESMAVEIAAIGNQAVAHALRHSNAPADTSMEVDATPTSNTVLKTPIKDGPPAVRHQVIPGPVIMFDHLNPLNNIVLTQSDYSQAHSYSPMKDEDSKHEFGKINENEVNIGRLSIDLASKNPFSQRQELQSGDGIEKIKEICSLTSNDSKPLSFDRSIEGIATEVKDTEVNTLIAMKGNKDLLDTNSSLTLVDDALDQHLDVSMENLETETDKTASVRVIYKVDEDELSQNDSEITSTDDIKIDTKSKKRNYSPTKQNVTLNLPVEVTPKPLSKMQKISNSPKMQLALTKTDVAKTIKLSPQTVTNSPDRPVTTKSQKIKPGSEKSKVNSQVVPTNPKAHHTSEKVKTEKNKATDAKKKLPKKGFNQHSMVQQFIAECCIDTVKRETNSSVTSTLETISETLNTVKSNTTFTSSKNVLHTDISKCSTANSEKNSTESCAGANVVAKIDMLPFMGSRDCEWESSSGDQWSFLLLREQLCLTVKLAHTHHNATRSIVRAETPLKSLIVDRVSGRVREPISTTLCLRLATEATRYECAMCRCAGDVPALLQRCHEVSRVAALWARVMYDAKLRLAYNVTLEGDLTVKVANIPLRSVWEIHMKIELEVSEERCGAFPRATCVHVTSVISPATPPPATLARLVDQVKHDWGHVPNTLWKVFRYLKNKTKDDDLGIWGFK